MNLDTGNAAQEEHQMPYLIAPFTPYDDLAPIVMAWTSAFAAPPNGPRSQHELHNQLMRHMTFPRFVGLTARDAGSGRVLGLVYGYSNEIDQWWRDRVADALGRQATAQILSNSFCLTELGVIPAARRRGIAEALVNGIEQRQQHPTLLLSTRADNSEGLRFYHATGWQIVLPSMSFGWGFPPYAILERRTRRS